MLNNSEGKWDLCSSLFMVLQLLFKVGWLVMNLIGDLIGDLMGSNEDFMVASQ